MAPTPANPTFSGPWSGTAHIVHCRADDFRSCSRNPTVQEIEVLFTEVDSTVTGEVRLGTVRNP
jgi:hypothetical protein